MTNFARIQTMIPNAMSSTKKGPLGTRKLLASGTIPAVTCTINPVLCLVWPGLSRACSAEDEDEQRHEGQVDEEHRLDQTDGQEEDRLETALGLGLTGDA